MIILGIDPGLNYTGWAVIETAKSSVKFVDCGIINPLSKEHISKRLFNLYSGVNQVITKFKPQQVSIEETFVSMNPKGSLHLGYARGVLLMLPALHDLAVFEYSPNTVKKTVAGSGHASKEQVKAMLKFIMPNMKQNMKDDAIDALSIALCHFYHKGL
ncbi:Crossover junction endodeoxyribonuclease RuvC [Candidatus Hepatincola sp. Pdp]